MYFCTHNKRVNKLHFKEIIKIKRYNLQANLKTVNKKLVPKTLLKGNKGPRNKRTTEVIGLLFNNW